MDCVHHSFVEENDKHWCSAVEARYVVTGDPIHCDNARLNHRLCGLQGRLFVRRDDAGAKAVGDVAEAVGDVAKRG